MNWTVIFFESMIYWMPAIYLYVVHYYIQYTPIEEEDMDRSHYVPAKLNHKQKVAYKLLKKWTKNAIAKIEGDKNPDQLLLQINGKAGLVFVPTILLFENF